MSRLEEDSVQWRKREIARNAYNENDPFTGSHENALSDGDDKGKGETDTIGSKTDIEQRKTAEAKNKYNLNRPYDDSTA